MKLVLGSLVAAVATFFWGFLSWTVLGWHDNGIHGFGYESEMADLLKKPNMVDSGHAFYMLPHQRKPLSGEGAEEKKDRETQFQKAMEEGPYMYAVVRPGKAAFSMTNNMILGIVRSFLAALILGLVLSMLHLPYVGRIALGAAAGLFAGLVCEMPMWIWFETPSRDLFVNMVDHVIEWTIGGTVLGLFVGKDPTAAHDHL